MTTQQIADRLVELCRQGKFEEAQSELFAEHAKSVEAEGAPNRIVEGAAAIRKKGQEFDETVEAVHKNEISDPQVAGNFFSCAMIASMTFKGAPTPVDMEEICVYEVQDGKIIKEEFFYTVPPQSEEA